MPSTPDIPSGIIAAPGVSIGGDAIGSFNGLDGTSGLVQQAAASSSGFGSVAGALGKGLGIAGGELSAFSAFQGANNTITADEAQADQQDNNAIIAERAAASAIVTGQASEQNVYQKGAQTAGAQRAALAANGVDVNYGSAANIQASTKYVTEQNANTVNANAARTAMGYTAQSENDMDNATRLRAAAAGVSPALSGASSLLTSASNVASNLFKNQAAGVI